MTVFTLLLLILLVVLSIKKKENSLVCTVFILGCGNFFDFFFPSYFRFIAVAVIFVNLLLKANKDKLLGNIFIMYSFLVLLKEFMCFLASDFCDIPSFSAAIYAYIIIVGIVYLSMKYIEKAKVDFWAQYKYYILVCLVVQVYRALFDYTFFGITPYLIDDPTYEQYYEAGESLFRPSSFSSPIVFSIELSVFFAVTLFSKGLRVESIPWLIGSFGGIMLTNSRSGMILIALSLLYYFKKGNNYFAFATIIIVVLLFLSIYSMYVTRLMTIFDFNDHTYIIRFASIFSIINEILNENIVNQLIGVGYGAVDSVMASGAVRFYTEDFYLGLIANSGLVALIAFVAYVVYVFRQKKGIGYKFLLFELLLVNIVAISLIMNVVQILFWFITFSIINGKNLSMDRLKEKRH